jgi:hypothetical protein
VSGGDGSLFEGDGEDVSGDHDSLFGGDSDLSDERAVQPPARRLKRSMVVSDEDDGQTPAYKRKKSISSQGPSEDGSVIDIEDSDDEVATPIGTSSNVGPSNSHQPALKRKPQKTPKEKEREREAELATVTRWRNEIVGLWKRKKAVSQVSNIDRE